MSTTRAGRGYDGRGVLRPVALLLAVSLSACAPEAPPAPREIAAIADPTAWELVPPAQDVYVQRRPSPVQCDPTQGYYAEQWAGVMAFKVDTGWCNFLTVQQPALVDLRADEVIDLKIWHFELRANAPAQAWLGLAIDGTPVWDTQVPIPGDPGLVEAIIELDRDVPEGAPLQFHVDNHGENQWLLFRLEREPGSG
ncbi:MAG: hypothetical protein AAGF11_20895 [Myxococcota bacterium]